MGRPTGSRNKGYFYRAGRGWYSQVAEVQTDGDGNPLLDGEGKPVTKVRMIALVGLDGKPLRNKSTPAADLKAAHRRIVAAPAEAANTDPGEGVTLLEVCDAYLAKVKDDGALTTYKARGDILYDFCYGLPARFRKGGTPTPKDRIHPGYGSKLAADLLPIDLDRWLQAHPGWKGGKRTKIQAVVRALNYGVESGLITGHALKGYKTPKNKARVTYITPEQEAALCEAAHPSLALAIKILIRTGARPGREFAALTAKHVKDHGERMEWVFGAHESKTKKLRTLRITDPEIMRIVRQHVADHPKGSIFQSSQGTPWQRRNLTHRFNLVKAKLVEAGVEFDDDCVLYSCRHTYAKRILQGYWSGKQTNIETLSQLMGNTPQVCQANYLRWTETYTEPLWESA